MAARNNNGSTFSVIGPDVSIKGDVTATADLHVDGTIEGDISHVPRWFRAKPAASLAAWKRKPHDWRAKYRVRSRPANW